MAILFQSTSFQFQWIYHDLRESWKLFLNWQTNKSFIATRICDESLCAFAKLLSLKQPGYWGNTDASPQHLGRLIRHCWYHRESSLQNTDVSRDTVHPLNGISFPVHVALTKHTMVKLELVLCLPYPALHLLEIPGEYLERWYCNRDFIYSCHDVHLDTTGASPKLELIEENFPFVLQAFPWPHANVNK